MGERTASSRLLGTMMVTAAIVLVTTRGLGAALPAIHLYESDRTLASSSPIDVLVQARLKERGIQPAKLCSDEVFVRRVYLDVIGTLPIPNDVRAFLDDHRPDKRAALIDALMRRKEFADYWSMKWCDILRVKSEFPSNLWPNAVQAYSRWLHDSLRENRPYDAFVRDLLISSGSNFRVPQVNFYRAIQGRSPATIAQAVGLTFMGIRLSELTAAQRADMAVFFSRITYKTTSEWKEEIVEQDPAPAPPLKATFLDGTTVEIAPDQDPREVFADWLIRPENPWFARNIVNRIWSWLLGRGIIQPPDDIRPDHPPVHPDVLAFLEKELVLHHYDLRHIFRIILNSYTYQQSSIPLSNDPGAGALFAYALVRQLDAEVLIDAICSITGTGEDYWSIIPEPYTFVPDNRRTIELADGSISSPFLEMFGRPPRDTGLESERKNDPSEVQRLHLLRSTHIQRKIAGSERLARLAQMARKNGPEVVRVIYLGVLSRYPSQAEAATVEGYFRTARANPQQIVQDLIWALINSKEFLYRH